MKKAKFLAIVGYSEEGFACKAGTSSGLYGYGIIFKLKF